jgi:hypothetical protein
MPERSSVPKRFLEKLRRKRLPDKMDRQQHNLNSKSVKHQDGAPAVQNGAPAGENLGDAPQTVEHATIPAHQRDTNVFEKVKIGSDNFNWNTGQPGQLMRVVDYETGDRAFQTAGGMSEAVQLELAKVQLELAKAIVTASRKEPRDTPNRSGRRSLR